MTFFSNINSVVTSLLQANGLFSFGYGEEVVIRDFAASWAQSTPITEPSSVSQQIDLLHLAAAEFALVPHLVALGGVQPDFNPPLGTVKVGQNEAILAVLKHNCNLITGCTARQPSDFRPDDLSVFSSDIRRMEALDVTWEDITYNPEQLYSYVRRLEDQHSRNAHPLAQAMAASHAIRLQGVLWETRLTVMGQPGYTQDLGQAISRSRENLGI